MEQAAYLVHITKELSGRWTIPILLHLEKTGGRFTPLKNQLQISPSRLSNNLKLMSEANLIQYISPNERHHPLLPEYRLTDKGRFMKEVALILTEAEERLGCGVLATKMWNWPILVAISNHYTQFNEIKQLLQTATPKIISTRLGELKEASVVEKELIIEAKPKYIYQLNAFSAPILRETNQDLLSIL
ncbi:hypothetical protein AJ85_03840 [Alkalihalobacillus alcalophilus ATCC 27647 = CGMCC 1.3604]|uniref:HTH hxlR-type domain-containing protein n=1 Tax=Alkalihalobacillus alcalophilus ATCC 27647 = CGMCC 1.3604 TaxID=1218173 RepID=A0A094WQU7_ALKAL|nr:winged helix-turn-helix transcriptional regulator [Alkalihalobacillus alcalophilus]KGA98413.1 hypothetical protein BALCAV_0204890 [Alkalihalobacillus alcalophilus ATCC 27647 = CGMCC 1.3604]MED1563950.1 winged helix-turn-helix transcriptional regulator [Alkalihalobacillus alcalophilus]THG91618.1 hypothetical protein AJ85_03840 [Alkalihalobacillus alcalophilus ATCC 27647 = CGMCC 1.3604]